MQNFRYFWMRFWNMVFFKAFPPRMGWTKFPRFSPMGAPMHQKWRDLLFDAKFDVKSLAIIG